MLTVPLTPETHRLIGRAELARMKPSAILVNIAAGPWWTPTPSPSAGRPPHLRRRPGRDRPGAAAARIIRYLQLDNVVITPHLGSATEQTRRRMAERSVENLAAGLARWPLPFPVAPLGAGDAGRPGAHRSCLLL